VHKRAEFSLLEIEQTGIQHMNLAQLNMALGRRSRLMQKYDASKQSRL
jgi:hypothetical protein